MGKKQTLASKEWLVVVYLSHFSRNIDDPEAPPQVTAGGISQMTNIRRSEVDGILKTLIKEGMVRSWSHHILGEPKKKVVYYLTKEGENLAVYILDQAKTSFVTVNDEDIERLTGTPAEEICTPTAPGTKSLYEKLCDVRGKKIPLFKVSTLFDFSPSLLEILMGLESDRRLSLEKIKLAHTRTMAMRPTREWVDFSGHVHKCANFFGRAHELQLAEDFLESVEQQIFVIKGIDGIGKTSLASAIASMVRGTRHIYWYDFHEHTSVKHLLTSLALFINKLKIPTLRNYLEYEDQPDINEVMHIIETALFDTSVMLVFEDVHKINDERTIRFFTELKKVVESMVGAKVMVTGRTMIPFYDHKDIDVKGLVMEVPLAGMDNEATRQMLEGQGIPKDTVKKHMTLIKGHPMYAELIANIGPPSVPKTINFYVDTELDGRLSNVEKKALSFMSVFRHPVPARAIIKRIHKFEDETEEVPTIEILDNLQDRGVIRSDADEENLALHDIIQEHFYDNMLPKVRRSAHRLAANYYLEEKEDLHRLEVLYHLVMADEHERAARFVVEKKAVLFKTGYFDDILLHLNKIDRGLLPADLLLDLSMLEGDILFRTGHKEEASKSFRLASKMAGQIGKDVTRAHALFMLGDVLRRMDMYEEATACYDQGIDILEIEGRPGDLARGFWGLGNIMQVKSSYQEACDYFKEALSEARKARDIDLASRIVTHKGSCLLKKGDVTGATEFMNEHFRMLEANRNYYILAEAHSIVGLLHFLKEDWPKASNSFQKGATAAKDSGNSRLLATNLMEGAIPFFRNGEPSRAEETLEEAEEILRRLRDERGLAHLELRRAELLQLSGDIGASESSYRTAIQRMEAMGDDNELSSAYFGLASVLDKKGDKAEADELRKKSMTLSAHRNDK